MGAISLLTACVLGTTRYYSPAPSQGRISLVELRTRADAILAVECPRVVHGRNTVFAATSMSLDVDSAGGVQRAELLRGSGDAALDDVFGALAAQLQLGAHEQRPASPAAAAAAAQQNQPQPAPMPAPLERRTLTVSYACASDAASIALEIARGGT
jgi:hypothetical protein